MTPADLAALLRVPSCLAGAASAVLGGHLAAGPRDGPVYLAAAGIAAAVGFANVVNDIADARRDAFDKPHRPLPSGRVPRRGAGILAVVLAVLAVGLPALASGVLGLAMLPLLGLAAAYSVWLKPVVVAGNAAVALCGGAPVLVGAGAAGRLPGRVWLAAGLAVVFMFAYETLKTIADRDGDAAGGVRTVATRFGVGAAARLFRSAVGLLTVVAAGAAVASSRPWAYLCTVIGAFAIPSWLAVASLGRRRIGRAVLLMRVAWFAGVVPLWMLR